MNWQLQDAKNRLSEVIDTTVATGPQVITRRGKEVVVVISVTDYKRLQASKSDLGTFFASSPLAGIEIPDRDKDATLRDLEL